MSNDVTPDGPFHGDPFAWDRSLNRLEDFLLGYPLDRALPSLGPILAATELTETYLRSDERALKLLHEALLARPLNTPELVGRTAVEVELLTMEVQVLTERLNAPVISQEHVEAARARLQVIRARLDQLREVL